MSETPENAIVVAEWAYATPLAYAAYVQRSFGGRIVLSAAPGQFADRYPAWLRARPVYVVSFNDALQLPGFDVSPVGYEYYHTYRITLAAGAGSK